MIGEALRLIRVFHDTSLTEMAKSLDISVGYLSEIENGKRNPNLETINRYAKHFNVRPSAIMFFSEEIDKETLRGQLKSGIREKMLSLMRAIEKYGNEEGAHNEM